jgi:mannan endo-1,4-beta-mannosidase
VRTAARTRVLALALLALSTASFGEPPAPVPAAAVTPAPARAMGLVSSADGRLLLDGHAYRFTGVNAYELTTYRGINAGCGPMVSDAEMDALFTSLRPDSMVRVWGFQGLVTNVKTHARDWRPLDRVVSAAARHGQRLVVALSGQSGDCDDGHWKSRAWYSGGFRTFYREDPQVPLTASYWDYVAEVAARYKGNPTIGLWEPVNEPEASDSPDAGCPDQSAAAHALRGFYDVVGVRLKRLDPTHLVGSGMIGSGQCGASGPDYQLVHRSAGLDVGSYHDYVDPRPLPGDRWNGLQMRLDQLGALGKPLIVGEVGVPASDSAAGCRSRSHRATSLAAKMEAQFAAGAAGFLPWNYMPTDDGSCKFETITLNDPVMWLMSWLLL